ncbi:response regulator [Zavarzinia sp. CC-PAN008]|uniref:response regulator n=1 Tax=Zavarzinia sp. CC-PAN008 TaxID=3243332 RepID=UPI003F745C5F
MREEPVVLVVEDEGLIRLDIVDAMEEAGYRTLEADNADDALALLEQHPEVRAVFADVRMPGSIDGVRLAHIVRDRWPPVALIVTSGHRMLGPTDLPERAAFVPKPYRTRDIVAMLATVIGGERDARRDARAMPPHLAAAQDHHSD